MKKKSPAPKNPGRRKNIEPKARRGFEPDLKEATPQAPDVVDAEIQDVLRDYYAAREAKEAVEDDLKRLAKELEDATMRAVELMDKKGIPSCELAGVGKFIRSTRPFARIIAGAEIECFADLRRRGYGSAIMETVHSQTLTSIYKEIREQNGPELRGIDVFEKDSIMFRRAGGARTTNRR